MLMGFMVVQGATAGSFSYRDLRRDHQRRHASERLPSSPALLFVSTFAAAAVVAAIAYVSFGGRALIARGASERVLVNAVGNASGGSDTITGSGSGDSSKGGGKSSGGAAPHEGALNLERRLTLLGLASLALGALVFDLDVGFTALTVAVLLTLIFPASARAPSTRSAGAPCSSSAESSRTSLFCRTRTPSSGSGILLHTWGFHFSRRS